MNLRGALRKGWEMCVFFGGCFFFPDFSSEKIKHGMAIVVFLIYTKNVGNRGGAEVHGKPLWGVYASVHVNAWYMIHHGT